VAPELVDRTAERLDILSILHYAAAGVAALFGCFPFFHVAVGAVITFMPDSMRGSGTERFPREFGLVFLGMGLAMVLAAWSVAAAHFFTARFLKQRRGYWFCVVVSALTCAACMFNTGIVGVTSLVILLQAGVREAFETTATARRPSPKVTADLEDK
jgi:hypothetical protein